MIAALTQQLETINVKGYEYVGLKNGEVKLHDTSSLANEDEFVNLARILLQAQYCFDLSLKKIYSDISTRLNNAPYTTTPNILPQKYQYLLDETHLEGVSLLNEKLKKQIIEIDNIKNKIKDCLNSGLLDDMLLFININDEINSLFIVNNKSLKKNEYHLFLSWIMTQAEAYDIDLIALLQYLIDTGRDKRTKLISAFINTPNVPILIFERSKKYIDINRSYKESELAEKFLNKTIKDAVKMKNYIIEYTETATSYFLGISVGEWDEIRKLLQLIIEKNKLDGKIDFIFLKDFLDEFTQSKSWISFNTRRIFSRKLTSYVRQVKNYELFPNNILVTNNNVYIKNLNCVTCSNILGLLLSVYPEYHDEIMKILKLMKVDENL